MRERKKTGGRKEIKVTLDLGRKRKKKKRKKEETVGMGNVRKEE